MEYIYVVEIHTFEEDYNGERVTLITTDYIEAQNEYNEQRKLNYYDRENDCGRNALWFRYTMGHDPKRVNMGAV